MLCGQQYSPQNQQHCGVDETGGTGGGFSTGAGPDSSFQRDAFSGWNLCGGKAENRPQPFPHGLQPQRPETCSMAEISGWAALSGGHPHLAGIYRLLPDSQQQCSCVIK